MVHLAPLSSVLVTVSFDPQCKFRFKFGPVRTKKM